MFSRLREHLGTAGLIVAIVALVAALGGAAIAANGGSGEKATASAKKKARKGPQGPKGATGPQGPQGPAGANGKDGVSGLDGEEGAKGQDGKAGKNGATVVNSEFSGAQGPCAAGGTELAGSTGTTYACNGKKGADGAAGPKGDPWTAGGTLPSGSTETGGWFVNSYNIPNTYFTESFQLVRGLSATAISFPIPLAAAIPNTNVQVNPVGFPLEASSGEEKEHCPGDVADPQAKNGFLCVYTTEVSAVDQEGNSGELFGGGPTVSQLADEIEEGTDTAGARIKLAAPFGPRPGEPGTKTYTLKGAGSWAVTAP